MQGKRVAGKRGKLPAQRFLTTSLRDYIRGALPTPPKVFDYGPLVSLYPMALNNELGDCTIAGIIHLLQIYYAELGETFVYPGDDIVRSTYEGLTGGQDSGLVELNVIKTWMDTGLFNTKIVASVPINPKDEAEMRVGTYLFGGVYLGLEMPNNADQQFENNEPWHLTIPRAPIAGGHCVIATGCNRDGINLITWGKETTMTWDFWDTYGSEAHVAIPEVFVEADHGPLHNFDILQLQTDLKLF